MRRFLFWSFVFWSFEFVSNFVLRASDFFPHHLRFDAALRYYDIVEDFRNDIVGG
jgi:hypothetical protein